MVPPTIAFARTARDGGILAVAALDHALGKALDGLPVEHGLSAEQIRDLKRAFGDAMAEIIDKIINPAVRAFPELNPSQSTWSAAVNEQAVQLSTRRSGVEHASTEPLPPPRA